MNKQPFIFLDTETTGLDPKEGAEIIQIAAVAINPTTLEFYEDGEFQIFLKPLTPELASPKAIEVIGQDVFEKCKKEGIEPKVGLQKFMDWINSYNTTPGKKFYGQPFVVGHNITYDLMMIHDALFDKHKLYKKRDDLPFCSRPLDTWAFFFSLYESDPEVSKYTLDSLASVLGMSRTAATHDALEDVKIGAKAFIRFMKLYRQFKKKIKVNN